MSDQEINIALKRLSEIDLLTVTPDAVDAHPLIREYFAKQLRETQPAAIQAAHSLLFDHLCENTEHRPDTLDGLQPLYQAVVHGCLAGRLEEAFRVYIDRILRGIRDDDGFYSSRQLGAIGDDLVAVAAFFDQPWSRVSTDLPNLIQAWLLGQAGVRLRALGRLNEAVQSMRLGLKMEIQDEGWDAASAVGNLSELEVMLGRLTDAVADARQAIAHADQMGDDFRRLAYRAYAANALHQSGQRTEAGALFAEAIRIRKEMAADREMEDSDDAVLVMVRGKPVCMPVAWLSPARRRRFALLDSIAGFWYCDWLLGPAECAAWQVLLRGKGVQPLMETPGRHGPIATCAEVEDQATMMLTVANEGGQLLDIALGHLTLARVRLSQAILASPLPQPSLDVPHAAVNGLRNVGRVDHLPQGLLTAALYHFVRGDAASARAALDEAQQIAERGPMPLYLADIHLHRARLFRDQSELAKTRALVEAYGYGRRKSELEDAEAAAGTWPA